MKVEDPRYKSKKSLFLVWLAVVSFIISIATYLLLEQAAEYDVSIARQRLIYPLVGTIIAGTCLICLKIGKRT